MAGARIRENNGRRTRQSTGIKLGKSNGIRMRTSNGGGLGENNGRRTRQSKEIDTREINGKRGALGGPRSGRAPLEDPRCLHCLAPRTPRISLRVEEGSATNGYGEGIAREGIERADRKRKYIKRYRIYIEI